MKVAYAFAALVAVASPAYGVTIDFEDGDRSGGGVFGIQGSSSIETDPAGLSGDVMLVEAFAGIFFNRFDVPSGMQYLVTSFDFRAVTDSTLLLGAYMNGTDIVGAALNQSVTGGTWTTITTEYGSSFIPGGITVLGDIRAAGGFYIDNIEWSLVDANYRPSDFEPPIPVPGGGGIPEPTTWAMLILGFGLVGGAVRSRAAAPAKGSLSPVCC